LTKTEVASINILFCYKDSVNLEKFKAKKTAVIMIVAQVNCLGSSCIRITMETIQGPVS